MNCHEEKCRFCGGIAPFIVTEEEFVCGQLQQHRRMECPCGINTEYWRVRPEKVTA